MSDDAASREQSRLWRILRTAKQMCYDRGYELTEDECNISFDDFKTQYCDESGAPQRTRMNFTARPTPEMNKKYSPLPKPSNPDPAPDIGTIFVQFNSDPNIGIKHLKTFAQLLSEKNLHTGIYVSQAAPTASALKIIPTIAPLVMEIFREEDLLVNISRHELVPKHTLLSP
ncbi:hypothetical protein BAUCODRAFT_34618, partial [Baudoinia panamericana UAMH 10762]